jgi:butyrate kinase
MNSSKSYQVPLILAVHPRIPFTNIGVFRNQQMLFLKKVHHREEDKFACNRYADETEYRAQQIIQELRDNEIPIDDIRIVIGRGGLIRPVQAGAYRVNEAIVRDLTAGVSGEDVVNLGGLLADRLSKEIKGSEAYIADPAVVDEFEDLARVSGHPEFDRRSVFHALEQKSVARKFAKTILKKYEDLNLIVAQMGNGVTVGAHCKGRVIDSNQGLDGDGPFSPARAGNVPMGDLVKLCFSGKYTRKEVCQMLTVDGGLYAYMGTHDGYLVDNMARNGDEKAQFYLRALAYQTAKTVGSMFAVLKGEVDAILLTGGLTQSKFIMEELLDRIKAMAPCHTYSSEDDVETLALNGYYIQIGDLVPLEYPY